MKQIILIGLNKCPDTLKDENYGTISLVRNLNLLKKDGNLIMPFTFVLWIGKLKTHRLSSGSLIHLSFPSISCLDYLIPLTKFRNFLKNISAPKIWVLSIKLKVISFVFARLKDSPLLIFIVRCLCFGRNGLCFANILLSFLIILRIVMLWDWGSFWLVFLRIMNLRGPFSYIAVLFPIFRLLWLNYVLRKLVKKYQFHQCFIQSWPHLPQVSYLDHLLISHLLLYQLCNITLIISLNTTIITSKQVILM